MISLCKKEREMMLRIQTWKYNVEVGEWVERDEQIATIETDKVNLSTLLQPTFLLQRTLLLILIINKLRLMFK